MMYQIEEEQVGGEHLTTVEAVKPCRRCNEFLPLSEYTQRRVTCKACVRYVSVLKTVTRRWQSKV